jgi:hypothetical protein
MSKYKVSSQQPQEQPKVIDEINDYWKARHLSAGEAAWRILGYHIASKTPAVSALAIYLPDDGRSSMYSSSRATSSLSSLDRYFLRPVGVFTHNDVEINFDNLTYSSYYEIFRLDKYNSRHEGRLGYFRELSHPKNPNPFHVIQRNNHNRHITRIHPILPSKGEAFYLRTILLHKQARSYDQLRTVDGQLCSSFQEAAIQMGLFADDNEVSIAFQEAVTALKTPAQLRVLFVHLLVNDCIPTPMEIWDLFSANMSLDHRLRLNHELMGTDHTLRDLSMLLEEYGKTLDGYGLPSPLSHSTEVLHELERWNNPDGLGHQAYSAIQLFNDDQHSVFNMVMEAINNDMPLLLFIDGKAGRGKTFLIRALCNLLRSQYRIVLATATSAFAAQQYPGGRTTHSTFKV